jgi:hypothetical protein
LVERTLQEGCSNYQTMRNDAANKHTKLGKQTSLYSIYTCSIMCFQVLSSLDFLRAIPVVGCTMFSVERGMQLT